MRAILLAIALSTAAAAEPPPVVEVTCNGADDCAVKWGRATRWILDHTRSPLTSNTDTFVATAPAGIDGNYYQLTRIPTGANAASFDMRLECGNVFDCPRKKLKADFVATVMR